MIERIARSGRFTTVIIVTLAAALASVGVTFVAASLLDSLEIEIHVDIALTLAAAVPLVVAPPIAWYLVGLLLRLYRLEEEMRSLASFDSLTGLLSRQAFIDNAASYVSLANRDRAVFSVLIIDLDHFKAINDRHGHPAGDAVLKLFADVVNSVARRSDIVGRIGGEEFAMILPSTSADEALEFSERLHHAIHQAVLKYRDDIIRYTASIGLTSSEAGMDESLDTLLARADLALYQAKRGGRDQTAVFKDKVQHRAAN